MIRHHITPRVSDLGDGFTVRRALPCPEARSVGPFVFFDHMGPVVLSGGRALDVRPHPHIGLATVTYLFSGEILHRDSLGTVQSIRPGEVNWMTAGRGIVHSERTPAALRTGSHPLQGIQIWVALPRAHEEDAPSFAHYAGVPLERTEGAEVRVIVGRFGATVSPVATLSPMFYHDVALQPAATHTIAAEHEERALYVTEGAVELAGTIVRAGELAVLEPGMPAPVRASNAARLLAFGGPPLDAPRYLWWNLVSSRRERIAEAAEQWQRGAFPPVPEEHEFIPLPAGGPAGVKYP